MTAQTPRPAALRHQVFRARDAIAAGHVTYRQLRSNHQWRPVIRGIYADSSLPFDHLTKIKAAKLLMPSFAVITGASAACLLGVEAASGSSPVDIFIPADRQFGPVRGLRIGVGTLRAGDRAIAADGTLITCAAVTAWELARRDPFDLSVPIIDALLHRRLLSHEDLRRLFRQRAGYRGAGRVGTTIGLTDGRAESPMESLVRIRLTLAGFPPPIPQVEIRVGTRFIARVDLAWPDLRIAIEYDGAWHGAPGQLNRDRRRLNGLAAAGWTVYHITAADLHAWQRVERDLWHLIAASRAAA